MDTTGETLDLRLQHVTVTQRVYEALVDSFLAQRFVPGQRLYIDQIAKTFGVSETPVKQALIRLSVEGTVEFQPGKGPYLTKLTRQEVVDSVGARQMCELYALAHGRERLDEAFIARLQEIHSELERLAASAQAGDASIYRPYVLKDKEFHVHLVSLGGNKIIEQWSASLNDHLRWHTGIRTPLWRPGPYTVNEHRAIVAALVARDWQGAEAAVIAHLANIQERLQERMGAAEKAAD